MCLQAEIASKILRRVLSARALDIFSIWERFMDLAKFSRTESLFAIKILPAKMAPKIDATECFDSHLNIEIQKASGAASKGQPWKGFRNQEDTGRRDDDEETRRKSSKRTRR